MFQVGKSLALSSMLVAYRQLEGPITTTLGPTYNVKPIRVPHV